MLIIRLQRVGRKNDPSFRVVVTDSKRGPKSGSYLEMLGFHNPKTNATELKGERIKHWMDRGAQVSGTVHNLLISHRIIEGKKVNVLPKKRPVVKEDKAALDTSAEAPEEEAPQMQEEVEAEAATVEEEEKVPDKV